MDTIARLRREHGVMLRLADALAREARTLARGAGGDLALIRDALRYLTEQPDRRHHPLEDLALWRLADRGLLARAQAEELDFEHRALRYHGARVLQMVDAAFVDVPLSRTEIAAATDSYAASLCAHVEHEEGALFPLLEKHLAPADWAQIDAASDGLVEPEHASLIEARLQRLLVSIAERTGCDCATAGVGGQNDGLSDARNAGTVTHA